MWVAAGRVGAKHPIDGSVILAKVLVADDERNVRMSLVYILFDAGYDVIEAEDGPKALDKAYEELPDLILLDVMMPGMDGFQVLKKIRENPALEATPVVMLTALPPEEGEQEGMDLGVTHYITKPWDPRTVELTARVALRRREETIRLSGIDSLLWAGSKSNQATSGSQGVANVIGIGDRLIPLEKILDGGLYVGFFTLMEGAAAAGTSILGQHLAYGALKNDRRVGYFTSQHTAVSLARTMSSFGMGVSRHLEDGSLCIYPVEEPTPDDDSSPTLAALALDIERVSTDSSPTLAALALDIERVSTEYELVVVDAVTNLVSSSQEQEISGFFSSCRRVCGKGKTVVVVAHSYAFNESMLARLNAACDTHLKIRVGKVRDKVVRVLEVIKANSVELNRHNTISFEVESGSGIRIIPFTQAKL